MTRLIVKSPYIKCGGGQGAGGYMKYIATRERVEIIPDDRPPTRKQEQLITKLVNDFLTPKVCWSMRTTLLVQPRPTPRPSSLWPWRRIGPSTIL